MKQITGSDILFSSGCVCEGLRVGGSRYLYDVLLVLQCHMVTIKVLKLAYFVIFQTVFQMVNQELLVGSLWSAFLQGDSYCFDSIQTQI